ncbi:MAG TPA: hypothetical protein PLQ56_07430 [Aggregatilineales bacterium]|nr:hypothetical protein [Aggregatilineales bacterium]
MKPHINDGIKLLEHISQLRSKVGVIYGLPQIGKSSYALNLAKAYGLIYVDITQELLPLLQHKLGVYDHIDFADHALAQIRQLQNGLIVDEVEPLLATFGKQKTSAFFQRLTQLEPIHPLILVTRLTGFVQNANFAPARLLFISG